MKTETSELRGDQAMRVIFLIDAARHGKLKQTEEVYGFTRGRALLVEPVNGAPFIWIDDTAAPAPGTISLPRVTRIDFIPEPRSGTDALRARMMASLHLEGLPETAPEIPTGELIVRQLREARRGPCQMHDQASTEQIEREEGLAP